MATDGVLRKILIAITVADKATAAIAKIQEMTDKFKTSAASYTSAVKQNFANASAYADQHRKVLGLIGGELVALGALGKNYYSEGIDAAGKYADIHTQLYKRMGANTDDYLTKMRNATGGTIDDIVLMTETQKALMNGLDTSKMDQIGAIARAAARNNPGTDPSTAYQTIMQGVSSGRMGSNSLASLGLNMRMAEALDRYALSAGKTAGTLTNVERKQAMMNEVLRVGKILVDQTDMSTDTYTERMDRFKNTLSDVQRILGGSVLPIISAVAGIVILLGNAFLALPAPVQTVIGLMGALLIVLSIVGGALLVQEWLLGVLAAEHMGLSEAIGITCTAYGKFLLSIFGATGAEIGATFATEGLTAGMWSLVTASAALILEWLPVILAVLALAAAVLYLQDLMQKHWEDSALHKHLMKIKALLDTLEKNPILHALMLINPSTAPFVAANDAANTIGSAGTAFQSLKNGGAINNTAHVQVSVTATTVPLTGDQLSKHVETAVKNGVGSGLFDGRVNTLLDRKVTKDFMGMGF
jgi:hypothetical protein